MQFFSLMSSREIIVITGSKITVVNSEYQCFKNQTEPTGSID
jgi:hypothetical protein